MSWPIVVFVLGLLYAAIAAAAVVAWHRDLNIRRRLLALEEALHIPSVEAVPLDELERSIHDHPAAGVRIPPHLIVRPDDLPGGRSQ